jgi:hypothetical protein
MHGHPWASVFAVDAPVPKAYNVSLDPENRPIVGRGPAPEGMQFPTCQTMNPQAPHAERIRILSRIISTAWNLCDWTGRASRSIGASGIRTCLIPWFR